MFKLYIGDKNYSSWSMRPWVAMKAADIPFEESVIRLAEQDTAQRIGAVSPSGRVPLLEDGHLRVWDSLAILEYVNELYPEARIWPAASNVRARARCLAAEMHSGFAALRTHMPMNIRHRFPGKGRTPETEADIARIVAMWSHSLTSYGGPFLFGEWGGADAMFAPVVMRFRTYDVRLSDEIEAYMRAVESHPAVAAWIADARADSRGIDYYDNAYA